MSYLNCLQTFLNASQKAFMNSWSLTQREIELEFQIHKGYKSLQASLGNLLSLDLSLLFPKRNSKSSILLLKYYDNNTIPLFSLDTEEEKENSLLLLLENNPSIKLLLNQHFYFSNLLVKKEIDPMNMSFIEEVEIPKDIKELYLRSQHNNGNFLMVLFELTSNDEIFNFSFIVEILKIWNIFNGHIKFKAREIPVDVLEVLGFVVTDSQDFMKILSCPLARFPVNIETEALMEERFSSFGYNSERCYYETQEYFMNLQTIQDSLISFKTEFNLEENILSADNVQIDNFISLDLLSGLYLGGSHNTKRGGQQHILTVVYKDNRPLLLDGGEILLNNLLGEVLCDVFQEHWNLKVEYSFGKRKTMADSYKITPAGIVVPVTFQILIFINLKSPESNSDDFLLEITETQKKEMYKILYGILSKRLGEIIDFLCEKEVYLTKKLRSCMEVPDYYVPKLTHSLANILLNFKDFILTNTPDDKAPKTKEMLKKFDQDQDQDQGQEKMEGMLKQGFYMALMNNKFKK